MRCDACARLLHKYEYMWMEIDKFMLRKLTLVSLEDVYTV